MKKVFNSIALCFSGGGYRASCFSFGVLSFFEKASILKDTKAISTVSGGTISGVKYTQSQIEGWDFNTFFDEYYGWLKKDELSEKAISHIKGSSIWKLKENKHKRPNPINAFAIEYNNFTSHKTLGDFQNLVEKNTTHLKRVVFNATDFSNGLSFRFQNLNDKGRLLGNHETGNTFNSLINKIKLGDILASSSAFPGGFEPIGFPHDFMETDSKIEIGLMDGGIIDNQGSSSLMTSSKNSYDLFFICDVASPYMKPFNFADKNKVTKYLTYLSSIPILLIVIALAFFAFKYSWWFTYTLLTIIAAAMTVLQGILFFASRYFKKATGLKKGLKIPPKRFGLFLMNRAKSLIKMATEIFLKNDRRQNANNLYQDYGNIAITCTIYQLRCKDVDPENVSGWEKIKKHTGDITENIKKVATESSEFGTTLWFNNKDQSENILDKLIACGEFTACFNLIAYLARFKTKELENPNSNESLLMEELKSLWSKFKIDPFFLIKERRKM